MIVSHDRVQLTKITSLTQATKLIAEGGNQMT